MIKFTGKLTVTRPGKKHIDFNIEAGENSQANQSIPRHKAPRKLQRAAIGNTFNVEFYIVEGRIAISDIQ